VITRLRLTNFKAWKELNIRFAPVTGIFGANSAGKSSLIQLLLLLKQTRDATDRRIVLDFGDAESLANLGSFPEVVHGHDTTAEIGWELAWTLRKPLRIAAHSSDGRQGQFSGRDVEIRCTVGLSDPTQSSTLLARSLTYRFDDCSFALEESEVGKRPAHELSVSSPHWDFSLKRQQGRPFHRIPPPVKTHLFPPHVKWAYQNADFLSDFEREYEALMDRVYYLGPLREYPRRHYDWSGASPADVGSRGERAIHAILAATARKEERNLQPHAWNRPFQEIIAHWLRALGLVDLFAMAEIGPGANLYQARVTTNASKAPTNLTDVGFGVSQVLPVLVLLYYVREGSVVLLEQPEIHLHPAVQSRLADLFLCVAKHRNLQIVVESHSQHLLQRLQRRVAEQQVHVPGREAFPAFDVSSDDVRLYFSSVSSGVSELMDLQLNHWGEIENWPDGFFGDEMEEISAISTATLRRKLAASPR
jgi:predicted ATPase